MSDEHILDESMGNIHECALALQLMGRTDWALKLAAAHGKVQAYLVENIEFGDAAKGTLPEVESTMVDDKKADEIAPLKARAEAAEGFRERMLNAVPQTWGEICQKLGTPPPCQPHEWDNRTTSENAVWALVTASSLGARVAELEKALFSTPCRCFLYECEDCGRNSFNSSRCRACSSSSINQRQQDICPRCAALSRPAQPAPQGLSTISDDASGKSGAAE